MDRIRRRTRGGRTLVELLCAIADDTTAAQRDRIAAAKVLLEYGFTKPTPEDDAPDVGALIAALHHGPTHPPGHVYDE